MTSQSTTATYTREVEGLTIPVPGTWVVDPSHSTIAAVARHLMVSKVRGTFGEFGGAITVAEKPEESSVSLTIDASSIDTRSADRNNHLRSPDFLDVESYPEITFSSVSVRTESAGWVVAGELTIRDTTRHVEIPFEFLGVYTDPWGNAKAAFSGSTTLDREAWGMTWNAPLETGGVLVSKKLDVEIELQAALQS
jgi:polyisoprenoid-binding protein YceI